MRHVIRQRTLLFKDPKTGEYKLPVNSVTMKTTEKGIEDLKNAALLEMDAIEEKGERVRGQIPDDYTEVVEGINRAKDEIVTVSESEPTSKYNKIWVNPSPRRVGFPTAEAFLRLRGSVTGRYVTPEQFGAVGDGETDDTEKLQQCFDYAMENDVAVALQSKAYVITAPLKVTDTIIVQGNGVGKSIIKKATNTKGAITDSRDAIILVDGNSHSAGTGGAYSYYHIFSNFTLAGNVGAYSAGKADADMQYAIYSKNGIIKAHLSHIGTDNVDVAIYSPKFWNSALVECRLIHAYYDALNFESEMQGAVVVGNNTALTRRFGYKFGAAGYAVISGNLAEWIYGGTAFLFSSCHGSFDGNGYELGSGAARGFDIQNSDVRLTGCVAYKTAAGGYNIYANGSTVEFADSIFGYGDNAEDVKLLYANNSKVVLHNCKRYKDYDFGGASTVTSSLVSVNGHILDAVTGLSDFVTELPGVIAEDSGWNIPFTANSLKKLRLGVTGYANAYGVSHEYKRALPKGSVSVNDSARANGVAGYITNITNNEQYTSRGTITEAANDHLVFDDYYLDDFGTMMHRNLKVKGMTSGATATLGAPLETGGFAIFSRSGTFEAGEKIQTVGDNNNLRNGDYVAVPALLSGYSWQRPSAPEIGTCYFDTALGKPIWYNGTSWVDSTGTPV